MYEALDGELVRGDSYEFPFQVFDGRAQLVLAGAPTGGTFRLRYRVKQTEALAYNASAATVQAALEALSTIRVGNVQCDLGPLPAAVTLEFINALTARNPLDIEADGTGLSGGTLMEAEIRPVPQDITGWTFWCTAKYSLTDADAAAVWQLTSTSGAISITNAAQGQGKAVLAAASWPSTFPHRRTSLLLDLQGKDLAGGVHTIVTRQVWVHPEATRATS